MRKHNLGIPVHNREGPEMTKKSTTLDDQSKNPSLLVSRSDADATIAAQIEKGSQILQAHQKGQISHEIAKVEEERWSKYNLTLLRSLFSDPRSFESEYRQAELAASVRRDGGSPWLDARRRVRSREPQETTDQEIIALTNALQSVRERLQLIPETPRIPNEAMQTSMSGETPLLHTCERFPLVVNQLQKRHDNRKPFEVNDEYDVQDLLHALLRLHYDDIRAEEWTPSYAGSSAKMDFLIPAICTVVETKKTRASMSTRDLGEQLLIDIAKYRAHPDCKNLVCLVYDPEHRINNPKGVESDLSRPHDGITVRVIITPREQ